MSLTIARNRRELDAAVRRSATSRVGLVPTMGALHAGHMSLIEAAAKDSEQVVVSIFVNPLQFGAGEDYERYPRTFDEDVQRASDAGATIVFAPSVDEMYSRTFSGSAGATVTVDPGPLGSQLEGAARPGHYRGVLTVVAKLFGAVAPDVAVFGEKDYQQFVLVHAMVREFGWPIDLVAAPTVREPDGLALSSRNRYLTPDQRVTAITLSQALRAGEAAGRRGASAAEAAGLEILTREDLVVDYFVARGPMLEPPPTAGPARLLVAATVGTTRLIDNIAVRLGTADVR